MAKKPAKRTVKKAVSKPRKASAPGKTKPVSISIEKVCDDVLKKLQSLNLEQGLQADIQWCLGSYRYDKNPSGLYTMAARALPVLKTIGESNPKEIPAKLILDIEKALKK